MKFSWYAKKCKNVNIWSVWKNQCILFMRNSKFFDLVRYIMVFNRILCQSSETSRIDVYIIVKDEEFQQCDKPSQYWIIKWEKKSTDLKQKISFLRIQFFIIMQPSILPYVTLTTQEALKWTLCDLWVVSIRNWIAPWKKVP